MEVKGGYEASCTYTGSKENETITYYLKADNSGEIAEKSVTVKMDWTAPDFSSKQSGINIRKNWWNSLLSTITFGLYKGSLDVNIKADDSQSGVAEYYYYIDNSGSTTVLTAEELDAKIFTKVEAGENGTTKLTDIASGNNYVIYAYAVDAAGNRSSCSDYTYAKGETPEPNATAKFGTVTYKYATADSDGKAPTADSAYTDAIPVNVGIYAVKAYVAETDNYAELTGDPAVFTIHKAANAPNMPQAAMAPAHSTKKVGDITLPDGWSWQEDDKDTALADGVAVTANAFYTGTDKGNYETESVSITITRSTCDHANTEVRGKKDVTCTEKRYEDKGQRWFDLHSYEWQGQNTNRTVHCSKEYCKRNGYHSGKG